MDMVAVEEEAVPLTMTINHQDLLVVEKVVVEQDFQWDNLLTVVLVLQLLHNLRHSQQRKRFSKPVVLPL